MQAHIGGNVWESNPPSTLLTRNVGFEVRRAHQAPIRSQRNRVMVQPNHETVNMLNICGKTCEVTCNYRR